MRRRLPARRDVRGGAVPRRSAPTRRAGPWCTSAACGVPHKLPCAARRGDSDAGGARRGQAIRTTKYRRRHPAALACAMTRWRRGARATERGIMRCRRGAHARRFHMRVAFQADNGVPSRPRHARDVPNAVARGWSGRARADSANRRIGESANRRLSEGATG
ncbi:hypothetical protein AQ919_08180 [Burkholderia pseudomallei]|nr:hypothetical protein AQ919_08180 [Burkholderia pseudomallei]ONC72668.1 hypothetical protein AQ921_12930 [Burkholderia pseudomallei]